MKRVDRITDSEWKVMEVLWEQGSQSASSIIKSLKNDTLWNDKTIRTLIDRLVDKKVLGVKKENVNLYFPLVTQEECLREATDTFINKIYKGSLGLLVANFTKNNELTQKDIAMLKELLNEKENDTL